MSAILITPDGYDDIATTVRYLRAQTIAARIELVIVAPNADHVHIPLEHAAEFHNVKVFEAPGGRLYSGVRIGFGKWSLSRRLVYAAGSPLIPLLRLGRVLPHVRRVRVGRDLLPRMLPALAAILAVHAAGEAAGYLFGVGMTRFSYSKFETRRYRSVRAAERVLWS